ncbi:GlxA family transcriptional regulator [Kitasatospora purpeofusca]|uniref:GlxA family transcriptional regulator n=1 Tax=Kitasatospora purpeofusca TaxID=67352 RepID=UPI00225305E7|nr:helix-turn-helix domain-containing protein [Kitasatospora purpeofusca]MCX4757570.1 DJ-1/PfpI family protein [Kitasatospora purpeofusca]WSR34710.1 DJ-1/PfpI family protein [Kitasatospora purpeofusca]WSR42920.1 DJ-1/PfpI family protein [Kitasatospora purpeofusca]
MRTVGCLVFDGVRPFDYAVIGEVWAEKEGRPGVPAFDLRVCGPDGARVRLGGGLERVPDFGLDALADCDLVVVPGVERPEESRDPAVLAALRTAHERGVTVASLCAGAFVLAEAGLLDGRTATTHWALADDLAERFPAVDVRPEVLFTGEGRLWTSAGVAAGIDLCLHLVRAAHGERAAASIARAMVTAPFRSGGQAQFIPSPVPEPAPTGDDPLARVRTEVLAALDTPWTVRRMAALALMSERTFARRFTAATGTTPLRWLLDQRILTAQRLLEDTDLPVDAVAVHCGFASAVSLRPPFTTRLGIPPREYRRTFRGRDAG